MTTEEKIKTLKAGVDGLLDKISDKSEPYFCGQAIGLHHVKELIDNTFPELKESKDERIRKAIGVAICGTNATSTLEANGSNLPEALDYLEKQKKQSFTHHEIDESLRDAVTHQMEDDGDVDDFVRRGIDDIVLKYAELGARWQKEQKPSTEETELNSIAFLEQMGYTCIPPKEQKPITREKDFVSKPQTSVEILRHYLVWAGSSEEDCPYTWKTLADAIRDGIKALEEQKPGEWSEEDETCLEYALWCVTKTRCCVAKDACDLDACRCAERWLESLRPQSKSIIFDTDKSNLRDVPSIIRASNHPFKENLALTIEKYIKR